MQVREPGYGFILTDMQCSLCLIQRDDLIFSHVYLIDTVSCLSPHFVTHFSPIFLPRAQSSAPTSAASPAAPSASCRGPLATGSWCCGMGECPRSSALCLLPAQRSLAPSSSTLLCGSETTPGIVQKARWKIIVRGGKRQKRLRQMTN